MRNNRAQMRTRVQELVILTLMAWATQTLVSQLARGDTPAAPSAPAAPAERFVPPSGGFFASTVEMRPDAVVMGDEIRLKQVARWGGVDATALEQTGDLVVARFEKGQETLRLDLQDLRKTLEEAGVNLGSLNFTGAMACRVTRRDVPQRDVREMLETPVVKPRLMGSVPVENGTVRATDEARPRTLKDLILTDLSERFGMPVDAFQVRFTAPQDEKISGLSEPSFTFELEPRKQKYLGLLTWDLTITGPGGAKQKTSINADVKAWQSILVANRAMVTKQAIGGDDVIEKRMLVDQLIENGLKREQVVGQQAARDISAGTPLTGRMIEAVLLVRVGQLVNVSVEKSNVRVKWVAEARESGSLGQAIRTRKPGTREEYQVLLTAAGEGKLIGPVGGAAAVSKAGK